MTDQTIEQLRQYLLIDDGEIKRRREFFGIDERVRVAIHELDGLFSTEGSVLADDLYAHLLNQNELRPLLDDAAKAAGRHGVHIFAKVKDEPDAPASSGAADVKP